MDYQKGEVVLIPFPFTDLSASKTRPAIVVSSDIYHSDRSELLLAYVSSQLSKANSTLDYVLTDWESANLPKPSFVRPKIAAIEPSLIVYQVGKLSQRDLLEVDRRLLLAMALNEAAFIDIVDRVDLTTQPADIVQTLAEKAIVAVKKFLAKGMQGVDLKCLYNLLNLNKD